MKLTRYGNSAWIINKHINDINLLIVYAKILKENDSLDKSQVLEFTEYLKKTGQYTPRWESRKINLTTALNKVSELCFYMFGYKSEKSNKFIFSPLGNLFLDEENDSNNRMYIFTAMLWSLQFKHPHNNTEEGFNLFPIRLLMKLLTDERLKNKLYTSEILYFLYFVKQVNELTYNSLIDEIISFRKLTDQEKIELMLDCPMGTQVNIDRWGYKIATETWWANKTHEWDYYFRKVLEQMKIITSKNDNELLIKLEQGQSTQPTFRSLNNNFIQLNPNLFQFVCELNKEYPYTEQPVQKSGILESEFKSEVYGFFPECLMDHIDVKPSFYQKVIKINSILKKPINQVKEDINTLSVQGENHKEFEIALAEGFNSFKDVKAERVGGAGKTDVECVYLPLSKSFAVEAKATKNSFGSLQIGRLNEHRKNIKGVYTILITPRYQPVVERDILNEQVVILKPSIFSEYLYNHLYRYDEVSYDELHKIIEANLGKDISRIVSDITLSRFSISA